MFTLLKKGKVYSILLILIALIFIFLRFYLLDKRIIFDWDQEQFSNQVWDLIKNHKPTLLGPRVTDDKGFFLAPYFTYILVPFFLLTNLHPVALVLFVGIINIIFFVAAWYIISKLFNHWAALGFLILWTFNALILPYDITPWWPLLLPIGILLSWYCLYQINIAPTFRNYSLLGVVLGFFIHMHFQFALDVLFAGIFLICSQQKRLLKQWPQIALAAGIFAAFWIPLFLFDLRHDFLNTHLIINYFSGQNKPAHPDPWVWTQVFTNVVQPFTYYKSVTMMWVMYGFVLLASFFLLRKKNGFHKTFYLSTLLLWILIPIVFAKYGRRPSEYYFFAVIPHMFIVISDFFITLFKRWSAGVVTVLAVCMLMLNWSTLKPQLQANTVGLTYKDKIVQDLKKRVNHRAFNISYDGPPNADTGFRYLVRWYGLKPDNSSHIPLVQIVIPKVDGSYLHEYTILMPKEFK